MTKERSTAEDLKNMFSQEGMEFSNEDGWIALAEHVEVHKYYLNQQLKRSVTWDEAVFSWYENIYTPLKRVVGAWEVKGAFPNQEIGELFLAVSDHWFFLKESCPDIGPEEAAVSFVRNYGEGLARFFSRFLVPSSMRKEHIYGC